ncbi:MAG: dicarboxylate/amino acid:cation symporter [Bacteroidales bacterium]|nr:dicarboxylate/amino acid:cation symporter [Bacteroidales bacterium]
MGRAKQKLSPTSQIGVALLLAIAVGCLLQDNAAWAETYIQPFGNIFLNLLKFIVIPLVTCSIMTGMVDMGDISKLGKLSIRTLLYFTITTLVAVAIGLLFATLMKGFFPIIEISSSGTFEGKEFTFMRQIVNIFPKNIVEPFLTNDMIQVIVVTLLFGVATVHVGERGRQVRELISSLNEVVVKVLGYIMLVAPLGVFCMLTPVVAANGMQVLGVFAVLMGVDYAAFAIHATLVYVPSVYFLGRCNPFHFFRKMSSAMLFAFSSDSSVATLPYTMKSVEQLGVRKDVGSFVLSLGATINMDGVAIYLGVTSVFIAACCGIDLTAQQYMAIAFSSTIASVGTPGVPGGALALMAMVFYSAGLPVEGVALVAGIDRLVDMGRTVMSITGDASCAVVMQRFENTCNDFPQSHSSLQ